MVDRYNINPVSEVERYWKGQYVTFKDYEALEAKLATLVKASKEVVRISDRKHDAWDRLKAVIKDTKEKS